MNGWQFAVILDGLPDDELDDDVTRLVARYATATCRDCGQHHPDVWSALACDDFTDARRRRNASRMLRHRGLADVLEPDEESG